MADVIQAVNPLTEEAISVKKEQKNASINCVGDVTKIPIAVYPKREFTKLVLAWLSFLLVNGSYYALGGVATSFYGVLLGSVTLGTVWLFWLASIIIGPTLVTFLGKKRALLLSLLMSIAYYLAFYYPSYYLLVPAAINVGIACGPLFTSVSSYASDTALILVNHPKYKNTNVDKLISRFHSITVCALTAGVALGSVTSTVILLLDDVTASENQTKGAIMNETSFTNTSPGPSYSCSEAIDISSTSEWAYYSLVSLSVFFVVVASILAGIAPSDSEKPKMKARKFFSELWRHLKQTFGRLVKCFFKFQYFLILLLPFYTGLDQGFYFSLFTRHFTAECLGSGLIGLTVIVWAIGSMSSSFLIEKISVYTSRTFLALTGGLLQAGMILFMLFWERVPSYIMVFLTSFGWGIVDGMWLVLPFIYVGIKVGDGLEKEAVFSLTWTAYAAGGATGFFLSSITSVFQISYYLWVMLTLLCIAVLCFLIAEGCFGEWMVMRNSKGIYNVSDHK